MNVDGVETPNQDQSGHFSRQGKYKKVLIGHHIELQTREMYIYVMR